MLCTTKGAISKKIAGNKQFRLLIWTFFQGNFYLTADYEEGLAGLLVKMAAPKHTLATFQHIDLSIATMHKLCQLASTVFKCGNPSNNLSNSAIFTHPFLK